MPSTQSTISTSPEDNQAAAGNGAASSHSYNHNHMNRAVTVTQRTESIALK